MEDLPKVSQQVMAKLGLQAKFSYERFVPSWLRQELLGFCSWSLSPLLQSPFSPLTLPPVLSHQREALEIAAQQLFFGTLVLTRGEIKDLKRHRALTEPVVPSSET